MDELELDVTDDELGSDDELEAIDEIDTGLDEEL